MRATHAMMMTVMIGLAAGCPARGAMVSAPGGGGGDRVAVPAPADDRPPVIEISNLVVDGAGTVTPDRVSSDGGPMASATVGAAAARCVIPRVRFTARATNAAGGVRDASVRVWRGRDIVHQVVTKAVPVGGQAAVAIAIDGHDGAGGPGAQPLAVAFDGRQGCPTSDTFVVEVKATNFHDQATTLTETIEAPALSADGCTCGEPAP